MRWSKEQSDTSAKAVVDQTGHEIVDHALQAETDTDGGQPMSDDLNKRLATLNALLELKEAVAQDDLKGGRRRRLSTCAGIGRIPPRLAAIGTSANSSSTIPSMLARRGLKLGHHRSQPTDKYLAISDGARNSAANAPRADEVIE